MQGQFDSRCSPRFAMQHLHAVRLLIDQDIDRALASRGKAARSGGDDQVFANFNTSLAIGIGDGLATFYLDLARDIDQKVRAFELAHGTELHKGSLCFNAAVCALVNHDFDAALYYFAAAGKEDHKTHGHSVAAMFVTNGLFKRWVTDKMHAMLAAEIAQIPATASVVLPAGYVRADVDTFLGSLPLGVLGSVVISLLRYAISLSFHDANEGTAIIRYRVVADLCVAYETTLKAWVRSKGLSPSGTLGAVLRNNLGTTTLGDISSYAMATFTAQGLWPCKSLADYDGLLSAGILGAIDLETDPLKKAAQLIHFVTHTRNQVVHDLDPNAAIYTNDQLCKDVARRVLVALCLNARL